MAKQFNIPASPTVYSAVHTNFTGCDYTTDAMTVDDRRFPDAQNLMLDIAGYPEKRPGFRRVFDAENKEIKMLRRFVVAGTSYYFVYAGDCVYIRCNHMNSPVKDDDGDMVIEDVKNCVFSVFADGVYIFVKHTGSYKVYLFSSDEEGNVRLDSGALDKAKVPTTSVVGHVLTEDNLVEGVEPSAGFESLESVNLLTTRRTNTFKIEDGYVLEKELSSTVSDCKPFKLEKPMYFYLDSPLDFPEVAKKFLTELYLRAFCANVEYNPTGGGISQTSVYAEAWKSYYGSCDEYLDWVASIGSVSEKIVDNPIFRGDHAKKLISFIKNKMTQTGSYANANVLQYSLNDKSLFEIKIYLKGKGYVTLPMVAACDRFSTGGTETTQADWDPEFHFELKHL